MSDTLTTDECFGRDSLKAENAKLRLALVCARSQLVTLGGHADTAKHGYGDDIQRAVLTEIDNALETSK